MTADRTRIMLAGNGSYLNRGCEAIERGTLEALGRAGHKGGVTIAPFGAEPSAGAPANGPGVSRLAGRSPYARFSSAWWARQLRGRAHEHTVEDFRRSFTYLDSAIAECGTVLALGGDNYTLDYGSPAGFFALNDYVQASGARLALWGASVGPFGDDPDYVADCATRLRRVDWILAREDETVAYLRSIGVADNVHRVSDPAFLMQPTEPAVDVDAEGLAGFVGLNVSPLFAGFTGSSESWRATCVEVVRRIVDETSMGVLLVPHVEVPGTNDREFMRGIPASVGRGDRVRLLAEGLSAPELKWVIGHCSAFAGARMHATVAALSMGVPTVSLSYSHKSLGINRDVFGHTKYVVGATEAQPERVLDAVCEVLGDADAIRQAIRAALPAVIERAEFAARIVVGGPVNG